MSDPSQTPLHDHTHGEDNCPSCRSAAASPSAAPVGDDASSQALSDALRASFLIVKVVMILLAVAFLCSGMFTVSSQEKAIILRFGKPLGVGDAQLLGPGLHFALPYPIDEVVRIPVGQVQTVTSTVGWYLTTTITQTAGTEPPPPDKLNPLVDGYTLTGDGNIIHVRATLRYRITSPLDYALGFTNAQAAVQNALNNALFFVSAQYSVDDALRLDVAGFKEKIRARVNQQVLAQKVGVTLDTCDVTPLAPRQVKAAFDAVLAAEMDRRKTVSQSQAEANAIRSRAAGETNIIVNAAETYRSRLVQAVAAEAKSFTDLLPEYKKNPELVMTRLQTETLQKVLARAQDKFFLPERADGKPREVRLQLNREPQKVAPLAEPKKHED